MKKRTTKKRRRAHACGKRPGSRGKNLEALAAAAASTLDAAFMRPNVRPLQAPEPPPQPWLGASTRYTKQVGE